MSKSRAPWDCYWSDPPPGPCRGVAVSPKRRRDPSPAALSLSPVSRKLDPTSRIQGAASPGSRTAASLRGTGKASPTSLDPTLYYQKNRQIEYRKSAAATSWFLSTVVDRREDGSIAVVGEPGWISVEMQSCLVRPARRATAVGGSNIRRLIDAVEHAAPCFCGSLEAAREDDPSCSQSSDDRPQRLHLGAFCAEPRCTHCSFSCWCDWKLRIERLIEERADINGLSSQGDTSPLLAAARKGDARTLGLLLSLRADVHCNVSVAGRSALHEAACYGRVEVCSILLGAAVKEASESRAERPAFDTSAADCRLEVAEVRCDLAETSCLTADGCIAVTDCSTTMGERSVAGLLADMSAGELSMVSEATPGTEQETGGHVAAESEEATPEAVGARAEHSEAAAESGYDAKTQSAEVSPVVKAPACDEAPSSAVTAAEQESAGIRKAEPEDESAGVVEDKAEGSADMHGSAAQLVEASASEDMQGDATQSLEATTGMTALMEAAAAGHVAIIVELARHAADVNARREDGTTALMIAAAGGHVEACAALVHAGCYVCCGAVGQRLPMSPSRRKQGGCRFRCNEGNGMHGAVLNKRKESAVSIVQSRSREHPVYSKIRAFLQQHGVK
eukprot:TRINITY_DN19207_c0_g1_i2.p1 TRINITY_DN19207_c0_g1~~TRINITY_DN19207_c0_g1_i2.p1  ORF type:complete len:620 (-),score=80.15 TRINITY_DN19207_c0_g1_i2:439-2298(-)